MARAHHNLAAWQQAIALVKAVYTLSEQFPPKEAELENAIDREFALLNGLMNAERRKGAAR